MNIVIMFMICFNLRGGGREREEDVAVTRFEREMTQMKTQDLFSLDRKLKGF